MCVDCNCGQPVPAANESPRHLELGQRLLLHNDAQAAANREHFAAAGVRVINLLSSPAPARPPCWSGWPGSWHRLRRRCAIRWR